MKPRSASRVAIVLIALAPIDTPALGANGPTVRVATYNTSLYRNESGQLARDLRTGDNQQARRIAEVIQRVRPDVMLINEFDFDPTGEAAELFKAKYLAVGQNGCEPIEFPHHFIATVNTGRPSGRDLDHNGRPGEPGDAIGFGRHEGQYGMLLLSRFPIDRKSVRTFQKFLWRDMPQAMLPTAPDPKTPFYNDGDLQVLRLSSKSFWDVPATIPATDGRQPFTLHLLCSHPTPPVFDGPEDRNGRRNHDEVRLIADYVTANKSSYIVDDEGRTGGLPVDSLFVIVGDLNSDPMDGDSIPGTMEQLLKHARVDSSFTPASIGGKLAAEQQPTANPADRGDPAHDTSNFGNFRNLRIDYVLPSQGLRVTEGGIFWPLPGKPGSEAIAATDHRLVWIDVSAR